MIDELLTVMASHAREAMLEIKRALENNRMSSDQALRPPTFQGWEAMSSPFGKRLYLSDSGGWIYLIYTDGAGHAQPPFFVPKLADWTAALATPPDQSKVPQILAALHRIEQGIITMSGTIDTGLTQLQADVTALTTVVSSAETMIGGIGAQVSAAVAAALAAGATPEQLAAITALDEALQAQTTGLAAAVSANTSAATP